MYVEYFQLREMPFSITPDPAYLYLTPRHQEALGHLLYGTGQYGGFVQLTGEVGTGKTTIVRSLLEQKLPDVDVAMIHNPRQSEQEFVHSICDELGVQYPRDNPTLKMLVDALNAHLLRAHAAGRRTVLIIDEAQNLMPSVLEQVRLLTNLETAKEKLLRIMLVGQPELSALLARPDLRQLASRITARYHLTALTPAETREYVEHRLRIAGAARPLFSAQSLQLVHNAARGNPRLINIICDRALMGAYALREAQVTPQVLRTAAREALGEADGGDIRAPLRWRWIELSLVIALFACLAMFAYTYWPWRDTVPVPAVATNTPQPTPAAAPVAAAQVAE
ncbi:MAG: AAA family ATPase, partial [Pseudomonadota bacterium]|nr:AAA family ATPase [Pseudomonadota bacterium]